jgi:hypothetical protein
VISDQKCVPQRVDEATYPVPCPDVLDAKFDLNAFQGRWCAPRLSLALILELPGGWSKKGICESKENPPTHSPTHPPNQPLAAHASP